MILVAKSKKPRSANVISATPIIFRGFSDTQTVRQAQTWDLIDFATSIRAIDTGSEVESGQKLRYSQSELLENILENRLGATTDEANPRLPDFATSIRAIIVLLL